MKAKSVLSPDNFISSSRDRSIERRISLKFMFLPSTGTHPHDVVGIRRAKHLLADT